MFTWRPLVVAGMVGAGLGVVLLAQQPQTQADAQQPPVTFSLEVNYVEVNAVVTDEDGNFVTDLTVDDFEVFEGGELQSVDAFSLVDIPVERAERPLFAPAAIPPDVASNDRPFDGRVFVLLLDDLHTTPLRSSRVKVAAKQFIERHLAANDLASVFYTSGRTDTSQGFTGNRRLLLDAVDKFMGRGVRSSVLTRADTYFRRLTQEPTERVRDELDAERGTNARAALSMMRELSDWLAGVRGRRKAVVFMSQGIDYDIYDVFDSPYASSILADVKRAIAAATQANVALYTLDPRGLATVGGDEIEAGIIPDDSSTGATTGLASDSLRDHLQLARQSLQTLAEETGGMAFVDSNDLTSAFARIVEDNSAYYVLGYYPTDDRRDGRFRAIEVRVKRPGLEVRSRKGYLAPRGRAPEFELAKIEGVTDALREVMANPLPISGLSLRVAAAPFLGERPKASVAVIVELDGTDLTFIERDGLFEDTVELSLAILDKEGKIAGGESRSLGLELQPATHEAVVRHGLKVVSRFDLEPGRYQVHVASLESGRGQSGSVLHDLQVPDFSDDELQMSGLALASADASRTPTAKLDEQFRKVLPTQPTTRRDFLPGDELFLFAEVYDNETRTPHTVDITTSILADDGRVMFEVTDARSSDELEGRRGGYGHVVRIPLQGMSPGLYVLRTEARSRIDRESLAMREVPFRIQAPRPGELP